VLRHLPGPTHEDHLRQYFLYLRNDKRVARSTKIVALCALKFLFEHTLHREWPALTFIRLPKEHNLPVVLSREEVHRILGCIRQPRYRVCLTTIYAAGLRIHEGLHLQVPQIDSDRMLIHAQGGKGGKDRYIPLAPQLLTLLRAQSTVTVAPAAQSSRQTVSWPSSNSTVALIVPGRGSTLLPSPRCRTIWV